ncbi:hypothetical protein AR457_02900 [Streptomyces agglomeratus]|uniref:Secreted protein n=1 Tax=Streptomyces agglomeratus TaxID=285458 RepID=A0A1E5P237_9ACTN|nr:hypothetical protein [Streptomyces agglomeratus]OEJ23601.1 hypothetical protein AS594_03005 [Streptomyces agglomeratus]OEJ43195.1 hypothetical protein AR457_02900 [Streptomyces agglomeratus]OEJ54883.1 hypothetical protein BGK72_32870 [Streptomyces agglomeratus]OEJ62253.1 hypothetical protein BGM19_33785 [Streptomyces agglomeratus]
MRTRFAAALGTTALAAGTLLGAPAAHAHTAAYPVTPFYVEVGNTWTTGTLTWQNRSVVVKGTHKSVSAAGPAYCRRTWAYTYNAADTVKLGSNGSASGDTACGTTEDFSFVVPADVPGGAGLVRVCLDDGNLKDLLCRPYRRP